jgi:hypothetical protein
MKGIFRVLSVVILLAALLGAGVLVKRNSDTRRGAASADTSAQVLPDVVSAKAGQTFTVDVWLNTGKSTDKLAGAEFMMGFDPAKVVFVSSAAQNGYTILAEDSEGGADRWFKMVAMGDEKAGAVNVVKLTFRAIAEGASTITIGKEIKLMVSGQSSTWDVTKSTGSKVDISGTGISCGWCGTACGITKPNMVCPMIAPPKDQKCVIDNTGTGCKVETVQKTCNTNADCGSNAYCYQPPMPACPTGAMCKMMMPAPYCKACTPRLACMDQNPACMPDLAPGAPPFCPPGKNYAQEGEMCGGIRGIMCATGLTCRYNPVDGLPNKPTMSMADRSGTCVRTGKPVAQEGEMCGGIAGIMCATGLRCEYGLMPEKLPAGGDTTASSSRIYPDQSGICVRDGKITPTPAITCNWCGDSCLDSRLKIACKMTAPPAGKACKNVNGKCTIVPMVTPTPWGSCGQRCTQSEQCKNGMTCAPIWWPCGPMPATAMGKVQADQGLTQTDIAEMIRICPTVRTAMPSGYESMTTVKMPTFYGVCRNPKCISSTNCSCTTTPTPTRGPLSCGELYKQSMIGQNYFSQCLTGGFSKVCFNKYSGEYQGCGQESPNTCTVNNTNANVNVQCDSNYGTSENLGTYKMEFSSGQNATVGGDVWLNVAAEAGNSLNKISATNLKIKYFAENFDVVDIQPEGRGNELKKEINTTEGTITLYYTWSLPADRLFNRYTVANIKLRPKKEGTFMVTFDRTYQNEMSGIDASGKSISYKLTMNDPKDLVVGGAVACGCKDSASKAKGDANCDGQINSIDFEIWRNEMFDQGGLNGTTKSTWQSDFNCDQKVSGVDFEIWRKTVFQ